MRLKDIAELAGVSTATVSNVLNNKDKKISPATKERVLRIVEETGYIPNHVARSLKIKETKTLGLIVPDITNPFFSELAGAVETAAEKKDYTVILCNSRNQKEREENYFRVLQEKMVDGIIVSPSGIRFDTDVARKIPVIILDRDVEITERIGQIGLDSKDGMEQAVRHLIEKDCRSIGFISSDHGSRTTRGRLEGYRQALEEAGIPFDENKVYLDSFDAETGYRGGMKLLGEDIDGICCGNDLIAMGVIGAAAKKGLSVPEDLKVTGFDDIKTAKYMNPSLTTIRQPFEKMGEKAVDMILDIIRGEKEGHYIIYRGELVERRSSQ